MEVCGSGTAHGTEIRKLFDDVAGNYLDVPGLIRKYFGFSEDAKTVVGIYLWRRSRTPIASTRRRGWPG
jgi:hypothetical protein